MLSFRDSRFGRREFLSVGSLALGGLSLSQLLQARSVAADLGSAVRDKSVVFLFLHGGPSQFETFDPKMGMPAETRSATGEISTAIPGITFGSTFPKLAALADRFSIVRSFTTGDGNHDIKPIVGRDTLGANLGSIYARVAGSSHPTNGMPRNVALFPRAISADTQPGNMSFGRFDSTGTLGAAYAPFIPGSGGDLQQSMQLAMPADRFGDRRLLLANLDRLRAAADAASTLDGVDRVREQAYTTILGGVAKAFDLSQEDVATVDRYDTGRVLRPEDISRQWNNYKNYTDNALTLGKLLLLARRLCEAGCGFVTVTTNFVWDMHADINNAGVEEGMRYMGLPLDHAVSAFIEDVHQRGLSEKILLVVCGEMGRTPKINGGGGRDHWGRLAPLLISGGGLQMGQVIGQSTRDGGEPLSEPMTNKHLISTILHTVFDVGILRLMTEVPSEVLRLASDTEPIHGLA